MKHSYLLLMMLLVQNLMADGTTFDFFKYNGKPASIVFGNDIKSASINPALLVSIGKEKEINLLLDRRDEVEYSWNAQKGEEKSYIHSISLFYPQAFDGVDLALQFNRDRNDYYAYWSIDGDNVIQKNNILSVTFATSLDSLLNFGITIQRLRVKSKGESYWQTDDGSEYIADIGVLAAYDFAVKEKLLITPRLASTLTNIGREKLKNYYNLEMDRYCNVGTGLGLSFLSWFFIHNQTEIHFDLNGKERVHNFYLSNDISITPFFSVQNIYQYNLNRENREYNSNPNKYSSYGVGFNLNKWYRFVLKPEKVSRFNIDLQYKRRKRGALFKSNDDGGLTFFENQFSLGIAFLPQKQKKEKANWLSVGNREELEGSLVE